jgi:hypothetical protein
MRRRWALLLACMAAWPTASARAQEVPSVRECEIVHADDLRVLNQGTADERVILSGEAEIRCSDGVMVRADSMISHSASGHREFIGRVFFQDSLKSLTADRVDYEHVDGRLLARGNVVLTDRVDGSVVRNGSELEYLRATDGRPESWAIVRGRPHATLYDSKTRTDTVSVSSEEAPPLEVDADVMEITGERLFRAIGNVALQRGTTHGTAAEAEFDQVEERAVLIGDAMIEDERFTLSGDSLVAFLEGEGLREVRALGDAILLSEDLRVDAPELQVYLRDGAVHRMIAMRLPAEAGEESSVARTRDSTVAGVGGDRSGVTPGAGQPEASADSAAADTAGVDAGPRGPIRTVGPQPLATATEFWLVADSIDAVVSDDRLEMVVAVGNAYGERTADSLTALLPQEVGRDWLRGDTIIGYFAEAPPPESNTADSAADGGAKERVVLERLVAIGEGGRAQSLYRIREEGKDRPGVNYLTANRITLFLQNGEVVSVEAEGPIRGYHLQPKEDRGTGRGLDANRAAESRQGAPPQR